LNAFVGSLGDAGIRLTGTQVQRLCGVDETMCQTVLDALVDLKFLRLNADGTYARLAEGHPLGPAHADEDRTAGL
jgi:hypothetical protein